MYVCMYVLYCTEYVPAELTSDECVVYAFGGERMVVETGVGSPRCTFCNGNRDVTEIEI